MVALTRFLLFCAVVLALPDISAAQFPPSANVLLHANEWLKDSGGKPCGTGEGGCVYIGGDPSDPNGVPVCSYSGNTCDNQQAVGIPFECVELAQRLYSRKGWYKPYGTQFPNVGYAYQLFDIAEKQLGFETLAQGGLITHVMPGDMIVHASNDPIPSGHVSIVDTIDNIGGVLTINVKEQNRDPSGTG